MCMRICGGSLAAGQAIPTARMPPPFSIAASPDRPSIGMGAKRFFDAEDAEEKKQPQRIAEDCHCTSKTDCIEHPGHRDLLFWWCVLSVPRHKNGPVFPPRPLRLFFVLCVLCVKRLLRVFHCTDAACATANQKMKEFEMNVRSGQVIDAAMRVHSVLGPNVLESAYEACLAHELRKRGLSVDTQVPLPLTYDGLRIDLAYRVDLIVGGALLVELKTVTKLLPIHQAQLLSYLRLSGVRLGLLINFHVMHLKDGIKRLVNEL
jgi:GxxExxY protein